MNSGTKEAHLNFEDETDSTAITTVLACTETYNRLVQMGIKAQPGVRSHIQNFGHARIFSKKQRSNAQ